jgi:lipid-binding SYLF domain-containing protein
MVAKTLGVGVLLVVGLVSWAAAADSIDSTKVKEWADAADSIDSTKDVKDVREAQETIAVFKKVDPGLARFFEGAVGYAVFPTIRKGAVGVGGAAGSGVVFEKGKAIGKTSVTQATIGLQLGGQTYSEIIFFETVPAFNDFKKEPLALAAQASAVAASVGTSANANYQNGVAIVTLAKGGLMAEASVGGQKFGFEPFGKK